MRKTNNLKEIRKWSKEKLLSRVRSLGEHLAKVPGDALAIPFIDELIVIYLEILGIVIREKKWKDASPLDMFVGVYGSMDHPAAKHIFERFFETKYLVDRFKKGGKAEKGRVRPQLVLRGMI